MRHNEMAIVYDVILLENVVCVVVFPPPPSLV